MRRSSSPTLTKTKGASSCPVFDPAKVAGSPFAFLIVAVLAISNPVRTARTFHPRRASRMRYHWRTAAAAKQSEEDRQRQQPLTKIKFGASGIGPPAWLRRERKLSVTDNSRGRAVIFV